MSDQTLKTSQCYQVIEVKVSDSHPHAYKPHLHSELSIGIIESGQTRLTINDQDYYFSEGDAVIIMPYVVHNCQPVDIHHWAFTMIYLDHTYKEAFTPYLGDDFKIGISPLGPHEYTLIQELSRTLLEENDPFTEEVAIIDCLASIIDAIDLKIKNEIDDRMDAIRTYLHDHYLEEISLNQLEVLFQINKYRLIRTFKRLYNITPSAYQLQLKVNHAKQLMKKQDNLLEVALSSGFYDQAHFTREFKKTTGMTPHYYIKAIK